MSKYIRSHHGLTKLPTYESLCGVQSSYIIIIIIIISDEEIRVTLSHRDIAGALYIN